MKLMNSGYEIKEEWVLDAENDDHDLYTSLRTIPNLNLPLVLIVLR